MTDNSDVFLSCSIPGCPTTEMTQADIDTEMFTCSSFHVETVCDLDHDEPSTPPEIPGFEGTRADLNTLGISPDNAPNRTIDVVFDGPPSHESGRFVETEDLSGASVSVGTWIDRGDGYWALRINVAGELS